LGKTPDELIDEADFEQDNLKMRNRHLSIHLNQFRDYLTSQNLAPYTIKTYLTAVKSFYQANYIDIPKLKIEKPTGLKENKDIPCKEDIQTVLKVCDPIEKAIILIGASSGLGAQEIVNLKIEDFLAGYDPATEITMLKLRRIKENVDFITFLSPEASRAVNEYIIFRNRTVKADNSKRTKQLEKQKVYSDSDYLLCVRNVSDGFLEKHDDELRKFTQKNLMRLYQSVSEKASKNTKKGDYGFIRSHNMRKYFNSALLNAGCDFFHVEYFMGHTLPSTQESYFRASHEKLKEIYKKYIPYLTIQKELDLSESPEYQAIKSENDILRAETAKHIVERQEIINLKNEVAKGTIEREELNALRNEIDSLYREIKGTQEGFKLGTRLVQKIHPNRLILPPDDGSDVGPDY
jgi:integrase